jgi:DNA polymerase-3 subunit epsilon
MHWFKRNSYPQFWKDYLSHFKSPQEQDLNNIRFVVFDTETTGLDVKKDRILSIGCIAITEFQLRVSDQLEAYINQEAFDPNTVKIHGLLKGGAIEKIDENKAIESFLDYVKNAVLVAHHAAFDVGMINSALQRMTLPKLKNKVLDTGHLFQKTKLDTTRSHFSLDELAKHFRIPLHDRHTASGDAFITGLIFLKVVTILKSKSKTTLNSLSFNSNRRGLL